MKVLLTGATGFIGGNLARELVRQGYQVRALVRKGSRSPHIADLPLEMDFGDLRDREALKEAVKGCQALFHVAAWYSFWVPDPRAMYDINVCGTENILTAALQAGVQKVVYTSTESTVGTGRNGSLGNERMAVNPSELSGPYKKTKYLAEQVALRMCREGLPLVVVNPTTPVGPGDVKPTPTGQFILDFLRGRMPAYVNTGLNLVDVEDVARGHILALEKGRVGERYLLGHRNLTFQDILRLLSQITGLPAPRVRIPLGLALLAAYLDTLIEGRMLRRPPRIPVAGVKAARRFRYFDCSKALRELGLPQTPVEEALGKAVRWFRDNGYLQR